MDTITHGVAGALLGKAVFRGEDMFGPRPMNRARLVTWSLMFGAIFPDADNFRDLLSKNDLLILTWHRSVTHSLVCLPIFAVLLAWVTRRIARWRNWEAPSFALLTVIYGIGILSHIVLDLVNSFGTMVWSPAKWSRPAWDLIFIIDFIFSSIFLIPQILAWVYSRPEGLQKRALWSWLVFCAGALLAAFLAQSVQASYSPRAIIVALVALTALFLLPALGGWGLRVRLASWNRAGLAAAFAYVVLAIYFHHAALARVDQFASQLHLEVQSRGAMPFPPSFWHWDGLVLTPRGVYETRFDLTESADTSGKQNSSALTYRFYPDAPPNTYINAAMRLREVQVVLWFSRFPVTRFHKDGNNAVVEIADLRFSQIRPDRPAPFTYRVLFRPDGSLISQGWVEE